MEQTDQDAPGLEVRESLSWLPGASVMTCPACKRVFLVSAGQQDLLCPICVQSALQPQQGSVRSQSPELLLPPQLDEAKLNQIFANFASGVPFQTPDLKAENLLSRSRLVYWPLWLVDADVKGEWQAMMGFDYQVKTARETLGQNGWSSTPELRKQTRFEPRRGTLERHYDNLTVPALQKHEALSGRLGRYDHQKALAFKPGAVRDAMILMPDLDPQQLISAAEVKLTARAGEEAMLASGAQSRQEFSVRGEFNNWSWTEYLLPFFSTYYADEDGKTFAVYAQAQSGQIYGARMASKQKATARSLILMGLGLLALCAVLLLMLFSEGGLASENAAALLLVFFVLFAIIAISPLLLARRWNSNQRSQFPPLDEE